MYIQIRAPWVIGSSGSGFLWFPFPLVMAGSLLSRDSKIAKPFFFLANKLVKKALV
jgi:hypothetical protein